MMWLAWRQFRLQACVAVGVLIAVAIAFVLTGPHLVHVYDTVVLTCASRGDCPSVTQSFLGRDHLLRDLSLAVILVPALMGMFWGAPLIAREMETGSFRLAWTQSVTRSRWIAVKLTVVGIACMSAAGLYSLLVTWWSSPFDTINDNPFSVFDLRDIVPIGYAAFAFALGVSAGVLIRRTLPAMAATLVAFAGVRFAVTQWVRPRLISPLHYSGPFKLFTTNGSPAIPGKGGAGAWITSEVTYNAKGKVIGHNGGIGPNGGINFQPAGNGGAKVVLQGVGQCPNKFPNLQGGGNRSNQVTHAMSEAVNKCIASFHLRDAVTYQPVGRYWALQWYELTFFLVLALLCAGLSWWWVRRRMS
jgi:hypothetical protein